jgi:hypothetical protein
MVGQDPLWGAIWFQSGITLACPWQKFVAFMYNHKWQSNGSPNLLPFFTISVSTSEIII